MLSPLGESVVGRMIGEFPTPVPLFDGIISALFGSSTSEGGILVVLTAVCAEVVIVGALVGGSFHCVRAIMQRRNLSGKNE